MDDPQVDFFLLLRSSKRRKYLKARNLLAAIDTKQTNGEEELEEEAKKELEKEPIKQTEQLRSPVKGLKVTTLLKMTTENVNGFFPVDTNGFWHGGVHLRSDKPLQAIADGKVVAYRFNKQYRRERSLGEPFEYSNGFVLTIHDHNLPTGERITFYCLYMNLSTWRVAPGMTPFTRAPEEFDQVIIPEEPISIKAGDFVGYAGLYRNERFCHFETFSTRNSFMGSRGETDWWESFYPFGSVPGVNHALCDFPKFVQRLASLLGDQKPSKTPQTIQDLVQDPVYGALLPRLAFYYHSEWSEQVWERYDPWRVLTDAPWLMSQKEAGAFRKHMQTLYWYDEVWNLPDPHDLWFFHPLGFIDHLNRIGLAVVNGKFEEMYTLSD